MRCPKCARCYHEHNSKTIIERYKQCYNCKHNINPQTRSKEKYRDR